MITRFLIVLVACGAALLAPVQGRSQDTRQVTLEDIWSAFHERQESVQTAKVSWKYRFVKSAYAVTDSLANERENPASAADIVFPEHTCRLSLAGQRVRFESPSAAFAHGQGGRPTLSISAFDGTERQSYFASLQQDLPHSGFLQGSDVADEWKLVHVHALTHALRPLRPELFGPEPGEWQMVDDVAQVDGVRCVVLQREDPIDTTRSPPRQSADRLYLDPARGFRLLRRIHVINGQVTCQVDARYQDDSIPDWVPTSWNVATYGAVTGKLRESSENHLISVVLNQPIPNEEFRIKFPPGTQVRKTFSPTESQLFVAGASGELVPIRPREQLNLSTDQLPAWRSRGLLGGGMLLLALAITWGLWRKRSRV